MGRAPVLILSANLSSNEDSVFVSSSVDIQRLFVGREHLDTIRSGNELHVKANASSICPCRIVARRKAEEIIVLKPRLTILICDSLFKTDCGWWVPMTCERSFQISGAGCKYDLRRNVVEWTLNSLICWVAILYGKCFVRCWRHRHQWMGLRHWFWQWSKPVESIL